MSENHQPAAAPDHLRTYEDLRVWSRSTFLLFVLGHGLTYFTGWFSLAAALVFTATVALAITTLVKMVKAKFPGFSLLLMVMIICWSLFLGFSSGVQFLFADASGAYADCVRQAVTISRAEQCTGQLSDNLLDQLLGR